MFIGKYQGYLLTLDTMDALKCTKIFVFIAMVNESLQMTLVIAGGRYKTTYNDCW